MSLKLAGEQELEILLQTYNLEYKKQFKFHPDRKWRADFALPKHKILIEFDGMSGAGGHIGGHRSWTGYANNIEKQNAAHQLGWITFRALNGKIKPECSPTAVVQQIRQMIGDIE